LVGFGPFQNQLLHFFTITLSHSVKAPQHDAHHFACGKVERYGHGGYLIKVVVMALAEEVTREPSPILSWSNNNYEI
jgi:hypothetical protein